MNPVSMILSKLTGKSRKAKAEVRNDANRTANQAINNVLNKK